MGLTRTRDDGALFVYLAKSRKRKWPIPQRKPLSLSSDIPYFPSISRETRKAREVAEALGVPVRSERAAVWAVLAQLGRVATWAKLAQLGSVEALAAAGALEWAAKSAMSVTLGLELAENQLCWE